MIPLKENVDEMFIGPFGSSLKNDSFVDKENAYCIVYEQKHAIQKTMNVETRYVDKKKYEELSRFNVKGGDIIVSCRGTIGETFIVPNDAPVGIMHPSIMKIRLKDGVYNTKYFNALLISRLKKHESEANGSGIKMAISAKALGEELFPVPLLEEQVLIANIIDKLHKILDDRKTEIKKLDDLIKARFVELFGDPIRNEYGWKTLSLLDSLEKGRTVSYGIVQTGDDFENGVPVFRPIDIAAGHMPKREDLKKTDPLISAQYKRTLLKGNELLITVRGSVGETFQTTPEFEGCNVGRNIVPLVTEPNKINQRFLQELFAQDPIKRWLKGITKGIALQGLNMSEFKEMPVIMPPLEKQNSFVVFAKQVDKSKARVQKALDETQLLFDSLMQEYFG